MNETHILFSKFNSVFGKNSTPIRHFSAPARINIIGEHVDYVGGIVLPAAINFSIQVLIQRNDTDDFILYSEDFQQSTKVGRPFQNSKEYPWSDYIVGVISELEKKGHKIPGFNLLINGNIPQGAGLSSSAALEVVVGYAIANLFSLNLSREDIALIGQAAENHFVGTNCGIMDQFIIATGKKDFCISLNTNSLKYQYHKFELGEFEFYLINSNVKHSLKDSAYNQRRQECESALSKIQKLNSEVQNLYSFDIDTKDLYPFSNDEMKRIQHITSERKRTDTIITSLTNGDFAKVGTLLFECHWSLSKDYEVSCEETDFIVSFLQNKGALGARMIGGGFGGCVLVLDKKENFSVIGSELEKNYKQKFGHGVSYYQFTISDGVKELI
ncbi:galactokinase [Leptospira ognonensis]|uniref:Galactokinase n=1 Tax=Leptospira ognonensis TaxID=2484945 RepID=A0A4R9JXK5_9LEPT|nr:galactokinase [Leptospira ognonensis]TGL56207.1 galactokinase [Leptospira ognonensis]